MAKSGWLGTICPMRLRHIYMYVERTDVAIAVVWPWCVGKVQIEATNIVDSISASIADTADMSDFKQVESFISSGKYRVMLVKRR